MIDPNVFARNITTVDQTLKHPLMSQLCVVPVAPGGFVAVKNASAVIPAGACFRLPRLVWVTGRSAFRLPWTEHSTEEAFNEALGMNLNPFEDTEPEEVPAVALVAPAIMPAVEPDTEPEEVEFKCECGKVCKTALGLAKHKASCKPKE